jgi:transmembrane sensor
MEPEIHVRLLVMKLISGDISGDERVRFDEMIVDESREEEFSEVLVGLYERERNGLGREEESEDPAWEIMLQSILKRSSVVEMDAANSVKVDSEIKGGSVVEMDPEISNAEKGILGKGEMHSDADGSLTESDRRLSDTDKTLSETDRSLSEKVVLLKDRKLSDTLVRKMPLRKFSWAIPVAASVAVLLGLTVYFGFFYKNHSVVAPDKNIALMHDVAPGGNRATLTLGNGATMILDSESIGNLAHQGNTVISKTDSGRLAYIVENNKPTEKSTIEENTLTTPRGGQYQLQLPDGTNVWLNSASSITYPTAFSGKQRFVKVTGEVYFEVVHNSNMPFVVKVGNNVITDVGTSFNINAFPDEGSITTTLITGSIKIFKGTKTNLLVPGQQEITSVEGESVTIKNNVDIDKVIAWRNGKMALTDVSVKQLMNEISRWYDVDIEYAGTVPDKNFYGSIRRDVPLSTVLNALKAYGVETKVEGKKIIVQ